MFVIAVCQYVLTINEYYYYYINYYYNYQGNYVLPRQRATSAAAAEQGLAVPTYPRLTAVPPGQMNGSVCSQRPAMHQ